MMYETHGLSRTQVYYSWIGMKTRCNNKSDDHYPNYGGRGITVCKRWESFENFFSDMGHRPENKTLDRKNNDEGYSKENCRWATPLQQARNSSRTCFVMFKGEKRVLRELSEEYGIPFSTVQGRLYERNHSIEQALGIVEPPKRVDSTKILYEYKGRLKTITQLANEHNINRSTFICRLRRGWPIEEAIGGQRCH